jgi:hypothetical protein
VSLSYDHTVVVSRASAGTQDRDTGAWTPGAPTQLYSGPADVQDMPSRELMRMQAEEPQQMADARIYLPDTIAGQEWNDEMLTIQTEDDVLVTYPGGAIRGAKVRKVRWLDGRIDVKLL